MRIPHIGMGFMQAPEETATHSSELPERSPGRPAPPPGDPASPPRHGLGSSAGRKLLSCTSDNPRLRTFIPLTLACLAGLYIFVSKSAHLHTLELWPSEVRRPASMHACDSCGTLTAEHPILLFHATLSCSIRFFCILLYSILLHHFALFVGTILRIID